MYSYILITAYFFVYSRQIVQLLDSSPYREVYQHKSNPKWTFTKFLFFTHLMFAFVHLYTLYGDVFADLFAFGHKLLCFYFSFFTLYFPLAIVHYAIVGINQSMKELTGKPILRASDLGIIQHVINTQSNREILFRAHS